MELLRIRFLFLVWNMFLPRLVSAHPMVILEQKALGNIRLCTKADKSIAFDYNLALTGIPNYETEPFIGEVEDHAFRVNIKRNAVEDISSTTYEPIRFFEDDHTAICKFSALALLSLVILLIMCFKIYKLRSSEQRIFQHQNEYDSNSQKMKPLGPFDAALTEDEETIFEFEDMVKKKAFEI